RLSGLVKLLLTETGKYPELARFYNEEFIDRNQALLRRVIQMGIDKGEFRSVDVFQAARVVVSPLLFAAVWRHSFEPVVPTPAPLAPHFETGRQIMPTGHSPAGVTAAAGNHRASRTAPGGSS